LFILFNYSFTIYNILQKGLKSFTDVTVGVGQIFFFDVMWLYIIPFRYLALANKVCTTFANNSPLVCCHWKVQKTKKNLQSSWIFRQTYCCYYNWIVFCLLLWLFLAKKTDREITFAYHLSLSQTHTHCFSPFVLKSVPLTFLSSLVKIRFDIN
jgi:hypothetical protein